MKCRHCGSPLKLEFLDLGVAPPSNAYLTAAQVQAPEVRLPLRLMVCQSCWLVQTHDYAFLLRDDCELSQSRQSQGHRDRRVVFRKGPRSLVEQGRSVDLTVPTTCWRLGLGYSEGACAGHQRFRRRAKDLVAKIEALRQIRRSSAVSVVDGPDGAGSQRAFNFAKAISIGLRSGL